jgi:hypothetical protein
MNQKTSPAIEHEAAFSDESSPVRRRKNVSAGTIESSEAAQAPSRVRMWSEVLGASLLPALVSALLAPEDPLLIRGNFPWLVLVPVLVGVQHGALAATLSSGLLLAMGGLQGLGARGSFTPGGEALAAFAGGCLAAGIIAGHFHDRVQARLSRLSQQASDAARRLSRLARTHAVVALSHRKLEERLAAGRWSLVSAFEQARRELARATSLSSAGELVLDVLANQALVQSATFLGVTSSDADDEITLEPCARVGNAPRVDLQHRLVQRALSTGRVVAIDTEALDAETDQAVLAVAPLVASSGKVLGMVLIHELPFMAFQAENLKALAVLTALLADMLEDHRALALPEERRPALAEERALRAVASPSEETSAEDTPASADEAHEGPEGEGAIAEGAIAGNDTAGNDAFVGTRTGTHRRRGLAQSA